MLQELQLISFLSHKFFSHVKQAHCAIQFWFKFAFGSSRSVCVLFSAERQEHIHFMTLVMKIRAPYWMDNLVTRWETDSFSRSLSLKLERNHKFTIQRW
jgi:hypothetical protein